MKKLIFTFVLTAVLVGIKAQTNYEHMARIIINELNLSVDIGPVYRAEYQCQDCGKLIFSRTDNNDDGNFLQNDVNVLVSS